MIIFVSNFFNHHQQPISEQLYKLTDGNYRFIEMEPMPESFKNGGYPTYDDLPMLIQAWKSETELKKSFELIKNSDVVLYGNLYKFNLINKRLKNGLLTFEVGERWFKRSGGGNLLSPRLLMSQAWYHAKFYNKPLYRLCASAYASADLYKLKSFKNKCYKWGYFTIVPNLDVENILEARRGNCAVSIMAIGRFLPWKHHELTIKAARILKEKGYNFKIDIYGSGAEFLKVKRLIDKLELWDNVALKGNKQNADILQEIRKHDAMVFTSDRNEGWGAVVNEAMGNACPVIGSHATGAVPYLIKHGDNGLIFQSGDVADLANQMEKIITSMDLRQNLAINAYSTMKTLWSPENAAKRLINLIENIQVGKSSPYLDGPCSLAELLNN